MGCQKLNFYEEPHSSGLTLYEFDDAGMRHQTVNSGISGMNYAGTDYFFEKNILGDVVGIYNAQTGAHVGGYSYDAWGNHWETINPTDPIVQLNPFRYRGYYYDTDTNLYYLNTRYYDPETGRFLNPDDPTMLFTESKTTFGANLYQYCYSNPIAYTDPSGEGIILGLIITAVIGAVSYGTYKGIESYNNGNRGWDLVGDIALGMGVGALAGVSFYLNPSGFLIGAGVGGTFGGLSAMMDGKSFMSGFIDGGVWGGIGGGFAGKLGSVTKGAKGWALAGKYAGQMGISMATYTGQTLATGGQLSWYGLGFSMLGGVGAARFTGAEALFVSGSAAFMNFAFMYGRSPYLRMNPLSDLF